MRFYVAIDEFGCRHGFGATEDWARFDAARSAVESCYYLADWPEDGDPIALARQLAVRSVDVGVPFEDRDARINALASLMDLPPAYAMVCHDWMFGEIESVPPPWETLPVFARSEDGYWLPEDVEEVDVRGVRTAIRRLRRNQYGRWYVLGMPLVSGQPFEAWIDEESAKISPALAPLIDPTIERTPGNTLLPQWVAGWLDPAEEDCVLRVARSGSLAFRLPEGAKLVPIESRGGIVAPLLDRHSEAWLHWEDPWHHDFEAWESYRRDPEHEPLLVEHGVGGRFDMELALDSDVVIHEGDGTEDDPPIFLGEHVLHTLMVHYSKTRRGVGRDLRAR